MSDDLMEKGTRVEYEEEREFCDYCGAQGGKIQAAYLCTGECQLERSDEDDPAELDFGS